MMEGLYEKVQAKLNKVGYRGDMFIADYRPLTRRTAHLLIGYTDVLGEPTKEDVSNFVFKTFEGKLSPHVETARIHKDKNAVTVLVSMNTPVRPIEDAKNMCAVASTLYIDTKIPSTWEVIERNGVKFLSKVEKDDIDSIIKARRSRMQMRSSSGLSFDRLASAGIIAAVPEVGDTVRFFKDDVIQQGVVKNIGEKTASIQVGRKVVKVDRNAIFDIVKLGSQSERKKLKEMYEVYKNIWGKDFADKLLPHVGV